MSTYVALQQLSAALEGIAASSGNPEAKAVNAHRLFWHAVAPLGEALLADIAAHLKCTGVVHAAEFVYLDPFFRQSATAVVFTLKFTADPDFLLRVECLVDQGRVGLSVRRRPDDRSPLVAVADHIERHYQPGMFEASLRDIPPFEPQSRWWR
jgi:hypothetical protein